MKVVGFDPGKGGGVASLGASVFASKLAIGSLADLYRLVADVTEGADAIYLEAVQASPPQNQEKGKPRRSGAKSMFEFGRSLGQLEMALAASGAVVEMVTPRKWQTEFGIYGMGKMTQTAKKNIHKDLAQELFPDIKMTITHAIADALLIAEYGRRVQTQTLCGGRRNCLQLADYLAGR